MHINPSETPPGLGGKSPVVTGLSTVTLPQMRKPGTHLRNSLLNRRSDHGIVTAAEPGDPSYHHTIGTPSKVAKVTVGQKRTGSNKTLADENNNQRHEVSERTYELLSYLWSSPKAHIHFHHVFVGKQTAGHTLWLLPFMKLRFAVACESIKCLLT